MTVISPSLLSCDFLNIESELKAFEPVKEIWFHLDIMDGHFVPNLTFGHPIIQQIAKISTKKLDAHLMVTNPVFYIETLKKFNIHNLTFHFESIVHHDRLVHQIKEFYPSAGISLNPSTQPFLIPDYLLKLVDLVLVMSVNPGFGGQSFIPSSLEKVEWLAKKRQELKANFQIQVDGGINEKNAQLLREKGADNLVAGSYIFNEGPAHYAKKIQSLRA